MDGYANGHTIFAYYHWMISFLVNDVRAQTRTSTVTSTSNFALLYREERVGAEGPEWILGHRNSSEKPVFCDLNFHRFPADQWTPLVVGRRIHAHWIELPMKHPFPEISIFLGF